MRGSQNCCARSEHEKSVCKDGSKRSVARNAWTDQNWTKFYLLWPQQVTKVGFSITTLKSRGTHHNLQERKLASANKDIKTTLTIFFSILVVEFVKNLYVTVNRLRKRVMRVRMETAHNWILRASSRQRACAHSFVSTSISGKKKSAFPLLLQAPDLSACNFLFISKLNSMLSFPVTWQRPDGCNRRHQDPQQKLTSSPAMRRGEFAGPTVLHHRDVSSKF
jgi:hypothetical protein